MEIRELWAFAVVAEFGAPEMALYGSSEAALVLLTKSWAAEYGRPGYGSTR